MTYRIRGYEAGDDGPFLAFDAAVTKDWAWPIAFDAPSLRRVVANLRFDPGLLLLAFDGDRLVGHSNVLRTSANEKGEKTATIFFPKTLSGHEGAREPLVEASARGFASEAFASPRCGPAPCGRGAPSGTRRTASARPWIARGDTRST